jgi:RNA polymerase sigma-70 factor (ECF subfamily)
MTDPGSQQAHGDEERWALLMVSAQAGHEADYRALLGELAEVIKRYLRSRFGQHDFVEDCVQDCLIAIHQARHTYDSRRLFRPWLFAIVRHKAIDTLRGQQRRHSSLERQREMQRVHAGSGDPGELESALAGGRLLQALSADQREVITLTKIMGLTTAEAADRLSISQSALKVRVHRALGRLRKLLEEDAP